jgi:outer membrane lipopolysaccharide assembly protein LptE/RlpB
MEEQRKQKDSKSITDSLLKKKAKIQEILSTKIFDDKKEETTNILIENNLELNNGEVVVVQMEEDEPMLNLDFDKMHANEIFGILG